MCMGVFPADISMYRLCALLTESPGTGVLKVVSRQDGNRTRSLQVWQVLLTPDHLSSPLKILTFLSKSLQNGF